MTSPREIAYDAYVQVMEHGRSPEDVTEELYAKFGQGLRRLDRNFIKELLYGSLRWQSKISWILQKTSSRKLDETSPEIRAALVLGTYQIFYMDRVPDRAAVNESVEYVRKKGQASAVSFVNGILRQIARRAEYFAKPDKNSHPVDYLALQFAHPRWLVERWSRQFKFDRMEAMLSSNNKAPPWTIRLNTMKLPVADMHELQSLLLKDERTHSERRPLRSALWLKQAPQLDEESIFQRGLFTVQDEASQLIGPLVDPKPGERIIDAACGKGGKLTHLYELAEGRARILGIDRQEAQLAKAREAIKRLGHDQLTKEGTEAHTEAHKTYEPIELLASDFLSWKPRNEADIADKLLLDAPCSGLGVIRRHPEGKWQKRPDLVSTMANIQRQLIEHALTNGIKTGGELIYSVCTFEPEETLDHLAWIKEKWGDKIEVLSPVSRLPDYYKRYVTRENCLLVFSGNQDELDGFAGFIIKKRF